MTESNSAIRTEPRPECMLCGQKGNVLYDGLQDRLFGAPGTWVLKKCPDKECGLVWLDPAPCRDDIWKAYTTYYTHQSNLIPSSSKLKRAYHFVRDCYLALAYGYFPGDIRSRLKWLGALLYFFPGRRADVDFSVMYLTCKPGGRLLEIGCGSGALLDCMGSLGWRAEGLDIDPAAVEQARDKKLRVSCGTLEQQHYVDDTFDAVIMSHVIEHVPDPEGLLAECRRILKPGGVLSLVTPNVASFGSHYFGRSWLHLDPPRHLMLYNCGTLHKLARKAGFAEIEIGTTVRSAHELFWASYSIRRNGVFTMGSQPGRCLKPLMLLLRLTEWAMLKFFPCRGEELSLRGVK